MLLLSLAACTATPPVVEAPPPAPVTPKCLAGAEQARQAFALPAEMTVEAIREPHPCPHTIYWKEDGVSAKVGLEAIGFRGQQDPAELLVPRIEKHPPRVDIAGGGFWKTGRMMPGDRPYQALHVWDPVSRRVLVLRGEGALADPSRRPGFEKLATLLLPYHGDGPLVNTSWD